MSQEEIIKVLTSVFEEIIPEVDVSSVTPEASLRDLGANSIDRAEIITDTMEQVGVSLPMVNFADAKNVGEIADIIAAGKAQP